VVIDGTLIAIDRVAKDRPFYSGKHQKHGMNRQVIPTPVRRRAGRALPAALTDSHTLGSVRGPAQLAEKHPGTDRRLSPSAHKATRSTARGRRFSVQIFDRQLRKLRGQRSECTAYLWFEQAGQFGIDHFCIDTGPRGTTCSRAPGAKPPAA
jgi:hypothetical protein